MIKLKNLAPLLILLALPALAKAQQPLSPPERPPVPLSDVDQDRARQEQLAKEKAAGSAAQKAIQIKAPGGLHSQHILSGNALIDSLSYEAAAENGLDPCLILSVMKAESSFNRQALSPKGASGLMQLMPATAARFGVKNIFDARENIFAGAKYLRWLLNRFGDVRLALAGYNAGEGAVDFYGQRIPPFLETQSYVRAIYARYSRIHSSAQPEPVVAELPKAAATASEKFPTYNQIIRFTSSTSDANPAKSGQ